LDTVAGHARDDFTEHHPGWIERRRRGNESDELPALRAPIELVGNKGPVWKAFCLVQRKPIARQGLAPAMEGDDHQKNGDQAK
ncbi:MAG: hypothetical protein B7Z26_08445, partial [Asticcacaulis sp. 32-58-5]